MYMTLSQTHDYGRRAVWIRDRKSVIFISSTGIIMLQLGQIAPTVHQITKNYSTVNF